MKKIKKRKKAVVLLLIAAGIGTAGGVVLNGGSIPYLYASAGGKEDSQKTAPTLSAQVQKGTISSTISGSGSLSYDDAKKISVLSDLKFSSVAVESGDSVKKGDVLATINTDALEQTILETQEKISSLDTQINTILTSGTTNKITANVAGRVKLIYASAGDEVMDVMRTNGALAVLSTDGKMAVTISASQSLTVGGSVNVKLSGGTVVTGTVKSSGDGTAVITVTDNGTTYGDTVTVSLSDGTTLGSGTLEINAPITVVGTNGTVSAVNVSKNQKVSSGTTLFTLKSGTQTSEYKKLTSQRSELAEKLTTLLELSASPQITAEYDGVIGTVSISAEDGTGKDTSSDTTSASGTSTGTSETASLTGMSMKSGTVSSQAVRLVKLGGNSATSTETIMTDNGIIQVKTASDVTKAGAVLNLLSSETENETEEESSAQADFSDQNEAQDNAQSSGETETPSKDTVAETTSITQCELPVPSAPVTGEAITETTTETDAYTGQAVWEPASGTAEANTVYTAKITLTAKDGYQFAKNLSVSLPENMSGILTMENISDVTVDDSGKTLSYKVTYPATGAAVTPTAAPEANPTQTPAVTPTQTPGDNNADNKNGQNNSNESGNNENGNNQNGSSQNSNNQSGNNQSENNQSGGTSAGGGSWGWGGSGASGSSDSSGSSSAGSGSSDSTQSSSSSSEETSSGTTTAFTVYPLENMTLKVNIDELDVNQTAVGQKATVTLDAISGQTFEGTITSVSDSSSGSGSAKYTAVISIKKEDSMRAGMTASAVITTSEASDVLVVPSDAVTEDGNTSYVYTQVDETTGELSGKTEVTTGVSDGTQVEIKSGLSEGDTVYYQKNENATASSSSSSDSSDSMGGDFGGGFGGGDFGGGGGDFGGGPGGGMD